jgi:hypothetical protein
MCVCYVRCGSRWRVCECERTSLQPDFRLRVLLQPRWNRIFLYWLHGIQLYMHNSSQQVYAWWVSSPPVPVSTLLCLWRYTLFKVTFPWLVYLTSICHLWVLSTLWVLCAGTDTKPLSVSHQLLVSVTQVTGISIVSLCMNVWMFVI